MYGDKIFLKAAKVYLPAGWSALNVPADEYRRVSRKAILLYWYRGIRLGKSHGCDGSDTVSLVMHDIIDNTVIRGSNLPVSERSNQLALILVDAVCSQYRLEP